MSKRDIVDYILLYVFVIASLICFVHTIIRGDIALGTCGIVSFILVGLSMYGRANE